MGVSCDTILGFDRSKDKAEIKDICNTLYKYRFTDSDKSRRILYEGLKLFSDNGVILNNLLCNMDIYETPDEVIATAEKIIERTIYPEE